MTKAEKIGRVLDRGELTSNRDIAQVVGCSTRLVTVVKSRRRALEPGQSLREQVQRLNQDVQDLRRAFLRFTQGVRGQAGAVSPASFQVHTISLGRRPKRFAS